MPMGLYLEKIRSIFFLSFSIFHRVYACTKVYEYRHGREVLFQLTVYLFKERSVRYYQ